MPHSWTKQLCLTLAILCLENTVAAQNQVKPTSNMDIASVLEVDFVEAWEAADASALAELWIEDGDWSSIVGSRNVVVGKSRIEGVWAVGLQGRDTERELKLQVNVSNIRMIDSDIALVDLVMTFAEDTPGTVREAFVMVFKKTGPDWKIVSARAARLRD